MPCGRAPATHCWRLDPDAKYARLDGHPPGPPLPFGSFYALVQRDDLPLVKQR